MVGGGMRHRRASTDWGSQPGDPIIESPFVPLRETFHFEIMQVSRSNFVLNKNGSSDGGENVAAASAMLGEELLMDLQRYYDELSMSSGEDESLVVELARQAFVLPQKKADQLMTFFDSNKASATPIPLP